tara:strand:+ start:16714 stop:17217 length:504 start_codon:yes stop_codon:yes gene_type:complete
MKNTFAVLFTLAFVHIVSAQDWVDVSLDKKTTLSFSSKPEVTNSGNKKIYQLITENYLMNTVVADLSGNPNFKITSNDLDQFYEGIIKGSLNAAKDAKVLSKKNIKNNNFQGRQIIYTKDFNGIDDLQITKQIYLVGKKVIIIEFWKFTESDVSSIASKFFNSFKTL